MESKTERPNDDTLPIKIQSAIDIFDQIDTGELVKNLEKEVTGAWGYEFTMDGKPVRGLSAAGAHETCRFIAHNSAGQIVIRTIGLESLIEEPDCFKAAVKAGSYILGFVGGKPAEFLLDTAIGFAKQVKKGERTNPKAIQEKGQYYPIPHAEAIAVSKAERNAKSKLIPDKIKAKVIESALNKGKVSKGDPDSPEEQQSNGNGNGFISEDEYTDMFTLMKDHKVNANHLLNHCKKKYGYTSLRNIKKDKFKEILAWIELGGKSE